MNTQNPLAQTLNETHWPTDIPKDHASFLKMCYESETFEDAKVRVQDEHANKDPETMNTQNPLARVPAPVDTERNVTRKERIESVAGEIKSPRELTTRKRKRDENETTEEKMRKAEHKVAQLFRCTEEAKPKIFWKPLTQEEYIERQKRKRQRRTYQDRRTREDRRRKDYHRNDRRDHHDRRDRRGYRRDHHDGREKIGDGRIIIEMTDEIIMTEEIDADIVGIMTEGTVAIAIMGDAIEEITTGGATGHDRGDAEAIDRCIEEATLLIKK